MASVKRKNGESYLYHRVRVRRDSSEEINGSFIDNATRPRRSDLAITSPVAEFEDRWSDNQSDLADAAPVSTSESESESAKSISFGALAKAKATLGRSGERGAFGLYHEDARISKENEMWEGNETKERKAGHRDERQFSRASKHAPVEISSKRAVSRKRDIIPVIKPEYRDPRFESLSGRLDDSVLRKAYSFLDDYREDEMKELKTAIKKAKDGLERENLKRSLLSMESRKKDQERKRKEAEILERHMKQEKELVKQGKKPFYLKKSEQKKRLLVERYGELKCKQLDRVLERRRKKTEGKEKKKLPWSRRDVVEANDT